MSLNNTHPHDGIGRLFGCRRCLPRRLPHFLITVESDLR
jgi:hypothetical protein